MKWIQFAQRDYDVAAYLTENFRPLPVENICYGCQQAVEKSLKAILIYYTGDHPKTHDLVTLNNLCKQHTQEIALENKIAGLITRFATKSRYPDEVYDFTNEDVEIGLKYANQVIDKVREIITNAEKARKQEPPLENQTTE
jgi:HEPN domain-containing protein